ncbi:MAG: hypothetical protein ACRDY1_08540 [Acidimicrobiales bacterium]
MALRRRTLAIGVLATALVLPVLGPSAVASAKAKPGCHRTHSCKAGKGGAGASGGAVPGPLTIQVDPNPLVETASSDIAVVIQVEASPSLAGATVDLTSSQLDASCSDFTGFLVGTKGFLTFDSFSPPQPLLIPLTLDDDGNAAIDLFGLECAPGSDVLEASMTTAPYYTALGTLVAGPPVVSAPGVFAFPNSSGPVSGGEVETGDGGVDLPESNIYIVIYVETDPVYAEQQATVTWTQLADRCQDSNGFVALLQGRLTADQASPGGTLPSATAQIDDDGNAALIFTGSSCAAGSSVITADVDAGSHPTYTTTFTILPPQPTI